LLFDKFKNLSDFTNKDLFDIRYLNPIRLIVYYPNASIEEIEHLRLDKVISHYYYFIVTNQKLKTIKLWTFDNRNDRKYCVENLQSSVCLNEFSLFNLKWNIEPIIPKKHKNFNGCIMNIGIQDETNFFRSYFRNNKTIMNNFLISLLKAISKHLNFKYIGKFCTYRDCSDQIYVGTHIYNILSVLTIEGVLIGQSKTKEKMRWMHTMMNIECTLV